MVPSQGPSNGYGGYDPLGRVPLMRADDGRVVSARRYDAYSGALLGECKRFGDSLACGAVSGSAFGAPPGLDPAKDLYRTDQVAATYRGAKLASYEDSGAATRYTNAYLPNGRLSTSQATPTGTVGSLTQDWLETFLFNGIGNLARVDAQRNTASANGRPDRYETEWYTPEMPGAGKALDRVVAVGSRLSETNGGAVIKGTAAATPGTTNYAYDLLGHLTRVTRTSGESETLLYAPGGELLYRQVGEKFTFYVGEYATVTAFGTPGCGASCVPQAATVEVDAHVVFAGTRIASVKPSRTLYYYRTRLATVVATSLGGGVLGAGYRYTPYGEVELSVNETEATRSELGYTNALRLTGSLLYLKNRVYDAEARVFIQPDTVDRLRYAYVMGDPANFSDPTGLAMVADSLNPMNPVQRLMTEAMAFWSRESWFTKAEPVAKQAPTSQEQTNKEGEKQKEHQAALTVEQKKVDQEAGQEEAQRVPLTPEEGAKIVSTAREWKGVPYQADAGEKSSKDGADCSGAVYKIYGEAGFSYNYLDSKSFAASESFKKVDAPHPGDVGVWVSKDGKTGHVAIYDPQADPAMGKSGKPVQADTWSARSGAGRFDSAPQRWFADHYQTEVTWYRYQRMP